MTLPINFEYLAECAKQGGCESTYIICTAFFSFIVGSCGIMMLINYMIFAGPIKTIYTMYKDLLHGFSIAGGAAIGFFVSLVYILFYIAIALTVIIGGIWLWISIWFICTGFFEKIAYTLI